MNKKNDLNRIEKLRQEVLSFYKYFFNSEPDEQFVKYYIKANCNNLTYKYHDYISLSFLIKIKVNPFLIEPIFRVIERRNLLTFKLFLFMQLVEVFNLKMPKYKIISLYLFFPFILFFLLHFLKNNAI